MNKFERYSIVAGIALSAISSVASAYAAWQTAQQAKIAQQALTAADLNRGFENFYDEWSNLCATIDVTGGYIGFSVKSINNFEMVVVDATDLGYSFAPLEQPAYRMSVIKAMDKAIAAHDKLAMWLPKATIDTMKFDDVVRNLIILSRVDTSENQARHYSALFKQTGYCQLWQSWFIGWFNQGYPPAPDIYTRNIRLVFNSRDGNALNDDYIRESRKQPWDEIHRYAPP